MVTAQRALAGPADISLSRRDWYPINDAGMTAIQDRPTASELWQEELYSAASSPRKFRIADVAEIIIVDGWVPSWLPTTAQRLSTVMRLSDNWDSQGAPAVTPALLEPVVNVLSASASDGTPAPQVVPTIYGGLQLEWHVNGINLEIEFESQTEVVVVFEDHLTGEEFDGQYSPFSLPVQQAIRRLSRRL